MSVDLSRILVTGGAGFIGSALIRHLIAKTDARVCNIDCLTYAGNLANLGEAHHHPRHDFRQQDVTDTSAVLDILKDFQPTAIFHLAAESHVDRSISGPAAFIHTNILGTHALLEASMEYWRELPDASRRAFRFLLVSTDEVFGDLGDSGLFTEESRYAPNSPYSASKAAADHLARAWHRTYGLPVLISNCSNNYGPYQYPEKLIPLMIRNALAGTPLPVYGDGGQVRDWLHVEDHVQALLTIVEKGRVGEIYCVGGNRAVTNLTVVEYLCDLLDEILPNSPHAPHHRLIDYVEDRPGHDRRYAIDSSKIQRELSWQAMIDFKPGLRDTVMWYMSNGDWCTVVLDETRKKLNQKTVKA